MLVFPPFILFGFGFSYCHWLAFFLHQKYILKYTMDCHTLNILLPHVIFIVWMDFSIKNEFQYNAYIFFRVLFNMYFCRVYIEKVQSYCKSYLYIRRCAWMVNCFSMVSEDNDSLRFFLWLQKKGGRRPASATQTHLHFDNKSLESSNPHLFPFSLEMMNFHLFFLISLSLCSFMEKKA